MGKFGQGRGENCRLRGFYVGFGVVVLRKANLVSDGFTETAAGDLGGGV